MVSPGTVFAIACMMVLLLPEGTLIVFPAYTVPRATATANTVAAYRSIVLLKGTVIV
jgi:hypothetical protein